MASVSNLTSIYNFFTNSETKEFIIPMYQRKYSWEKDQIRDFISDLNHLINDNRPTKYHFFGLIVISETEKNSKQFEIIDGQQRITTISLLISILRDIISDLTFHSIIQSSPKILDDLNELKTTLNSCLTTSGKLKLITLNETQYESEYLSAILGKLTDLPQKFQDNYADQPSDDKNSFTVKLSALSDSQSYDQTRGKAKAIRKNYFILNEEISELINQKSIVQEKVELLKIIVPDILDNFKMIPFVAIDQAEAFSLFETLNDRGLDVAAVDLIKNVCLTTGRDANHRITIFNNWKIIFVDELKESDGVTFLRYSYNSRHEFITKSELYKSYSQNIKTYTPAQLDVFLNKLKNDAKNYRIILFESNSTNKDLTNILRLLKSTNTTQYIVLALSIMRCLDAKISDPDRKLLEKKSIELLHKLHKLIVSILINGQGMNQIERFIPSLAIKLDDTLTATDLISIFSDCEELISRHIDDHRLTITAQTLDTINLESNSLSLCLINTINFIQLQHSHMLPQDLTLEHVFPVKPKDNEWPEIEFLQDDLKIKEECLFSIGNHIPILQPLNSEAQNKSFIDKKEIYKKRLYRDFIFVDTNLNIYTVVSWTPDLIKNRKAELNTILLNYFKP